LRQIKSLFGHVGVSVLLYVPACSIVISNRLVAAIATAAAPKIWEPFGFIWICELRESSVLIRLLFSLQLLQDNTVSRRDGA
jgi:hypothetical protein